MQRIEMGISDVDINKEIPQQTLGEAWGDIVAKGEGVVPEMSESRVSETPLRVRTTEEIMMDGMTVPQQIEHYLLNWLESPDKVVGDRRATLEAWIRSNRQKGFDQYPRKERVMFEWVDAVIQRSLADHDRKVAGGSIDNADKTYFRLVQRSESLWKKIERSGREVSVNILNPKGSRYIEERAKTDRVVVSRMYDDGPLDKLMDGFNRKFGRTFAALTGIAIIVSSTAACAESATPPQTQVIEVTEVPATRAPPTRIPPTRTPTKTATQERTPTPMSSDAAQDALENYELPGPTSFPDQATADSWDDGDFSDLETSLNEWARVWIEKKIIFNQPLEFVMADPAKYNSIHIEIVTGTDGSSFLCMRTTSPDLPDCYVPPIDPATGLLYDHVPTILPGDTFIALQSDDRPDFLELTSFNGTPALMDIDGVIKKVLGPKSTWVDKADWEPTPVPTAEFSTEIPSSIAGCNVMPAEGSPAYDAFIEKRDAAEKAWLATKTEASFEAVFGRSFIEYQDNNLPYNTVDFSIISDRIIACSRSEDGKMVFLDVAIDLEHVLHLQMSPSASASYQALGSSEMLLAGYTSTDVEVMLKAISEGKKVGIYVRMFENQSGKPVERINKMAGWEWARDLLAVESDDGTPVNMTGEWDDVGTWIAKFIVGFNDFNAEWQGKMLDVADGVFVPVAEIGWVEIK